MDQNIWEWVLYAHLDPDKVISAAAVRIVIRDVNNGDWYDDKNPLPDTDLNGNIVNVNHTPLRASLYEIEAYGN